MKKLLSIFAVVAAALFLAACGKDPLVEIEERIAKEDNPNRRELFSELAQIFRRERANQPFDATRGLAIAVAFDYPEYAEFFIEKGGNVNASCLGEETMLGYAAEGHFLDVCRLLVKHGADVNSRSKNGETPMILAIKNTNYDSTSSARRLNDEIEDDSEENRREVIEFLFDKGAELNAKANDGWTPLFYAAAKSDVLLLTWLIKKGADVRIMADGISPVQFAVLGESKSLPVLRILLENGANPNVGAESGFENSALKFALDESDGKDFSYAECLLKHGANVNTPSMLCFYVDNQNIPVVKFLLANGANPNSEMEAKYSDNGGRSTALFFAARSGDSELVKLLVEAGADVNKKSVVAEKSANNSLSIPVAYVCLDKPEIVKYLLERGADPNAIVIREQTLLAYAILNKHMETVKLLLDAGASPEIEIEPEGKQGDTLSASEFALFSGNKALFLLLKEKGAKLSDIPVPGTVKIPGTNYAFGKYEVTQIEYLSVMGKNPSDFRGGAHLPVEQVSWDDAVEFCKKLTARERALGRISENQEYRLPTEDEWEHACRAGTKTNYYTGNSSSDLDRAGWYDGNSGNKTHPVGQKEPNAFGLYDMHGNVWEWTSTPESCAFGLWRVRRGGYWKSNAHDCDASYRNYIPPIADGRDLGFRVVLDLVQTDPEFGSPVSLPEDVRQFVESVKKHIPRHEREKDFTIGVKVSLKGKTIEITPEIRAELLKD